MMETLKLFTMYNTNNIFVESLDWYWPKYHPYRNQFSDRLLKFKLGRAYEYNYFKTLLTCWIEKNITEPTLFIPVPSSKKKKINSISKLVTDIASSNTNVINGTGIITKRFTTKSACIGFKRNSEFNRSFDVHRSLKSCKVILIDDVCSTGKTFKVLTTLIEETCIWVDCFALGNNISHTQFNYNKIKQKNATYQI